jgi:hypothetical protein
MKRDRSDEELNETAKQLEPFPIERLPTDLILKIVLESNLSIRDIYRMGYLNKRFRELLNNTKVWDKVFIDRFLANRKNMTENERSEYYEHPEFVKWQEQRKTMPNDFMRILARIYVDKLGDFKTKYNFRFYRGLNEYVAIKNPEDFQQSELGQVITIHGINTRDLPSSDFEKYLNFDRKQIYSFNVFYKKYLYVKRFMMDELRFFYAMFMDGWVEDKTPEKLLESCVTCGERAHFKCSETDRLFCGKKCWRK